MLESLGKKMRSLLPRPEKLAAYAGLAGLTLGWAAEYQLDSLSQRKDVGAFAASVEPIIVHNSGWDARLASARLLVGENGAYRAEILKNGKVVSTQNFTVGDQPELVEFSNLEPRGGLGGSLTIGGRPLNFGYGYGINEYELRLIRQVTCGMAPSARVKL